MLSSLRDFFSSATPEKMTDAKKQPNSPWQLKRLASILDWRPVFFPVPRGQCQRLTLPIKSIPKRLIGSSLRLQLMSISGLAQFGFAWRVRDETAEIWFWDESQLNEAPGFPVAESLVNGVKPCTEVIFRPPLEDGLHLLICSKGFEAVAMVAGNLRRTRWFADLPDTNCWQSFVRDVGKHPDNYPVPRPKQVALLDKPAKEWKIQSSVESPMSIPLLAGMAGTALIGVLCAGLLAYDIKQNQLLSIENSTIKQLKLEKAAILDLQKQMAVRTELFERLSKNLVPISQLRLMQILAETGIFAEGTGIALMEWEYRNERLRLLFSVPKDNFSLGLFLSTLEKTGVLSEVRLIPDTAARTVGIQAAVSPTPWPELTPGTAEESTSSTAAPTVAQ